LAWRWFGRGRGGWFGPWPGRGPFSDLPPWERPGWVYGRGACWRFLGTPYLPSYPTEKEEKSYLEVSKKDLEEELKAIETRINELKELKEKKE
jgi:hypothetical protein